MQIVDKGSENEADTVKNNDEILVRFMEYSILDKDTALSNLSCRGNCGRIPLYGDLVIHSGDFPAGIHDDLLLFAGRSGRVARAVELMFVIWLMCD